MEVNKELLAESKFSDKTAEIIISLTESYQVIYRANIYTGAYEVILMKFDGNEFVDKYDNFIELEKYYMENKIERYYSGKSQEKITIDSIKKHFDNSTEPMEGYYKEKDGRWLKLVVLPDKNYSKEYPYVIYAIRECEEQIKHETESIIDKTAVSRMYTLVLIIDEETDYYNCVYSDDSKEISKGPGKLSDFLEIMKKRIYEEDYHIFESILEDVVPDRNGFVEREYRAEDRKGMVHFFSTFSTYVMLPEGGRKLLLVRNIDERATNIARIGVLDDQTAMLKNILFALGNEYFGIYICNFETLVIAPAREDGVTHNLIARNNNYQSVMERYVNEYVYYGDRDKIKEFTDVNNLKNVLSEEGHLIHCDFLRKFEEGYRWVSIDIQAVRFKNGTVSEIVLAFKDIHDEREAELRHKNELEKALLDAKKASQAKSEFLSNMSHDLRTPMNAVLGMTDIALNHMDDRERVKSCLTRIETAAKSLLSLINDVLDMSYIESGKLTVNEENYSLPELIHGMISTLQTQICSKRLNFTAKAYNVYNEKLFGDRVKLSRILTNVIGNAIKYTDAGKNISFTIEQKDDVSDGAAEYVFTVKDNGCGMSESFIKKIYKPFERGADNAERQIEGTGLGMSITKKYVDMLGGTIEIDSVEGVGTTFVISIPIKYIDKKNKHTFDQLAKDFEIVYHDNIEEDVLMRIREAAEFNSGRPIIVTGTYDAADFESAAFEAGMAAYVMQPVFVSDLEKIKHNVGSDSPENYRNEPSAYNFSGKRILVADDNLINADIAVDFLEDVHAQCETASNGKEAYERIASGEHFDAVLMDVRMPVMNGCQATRLIRELGSEYASGLPIIAMTANAFKQDMDMTRECGMNDHISKPMSAGILYSVLNKYLS